MGRSFEITVGVVVGGLVAIATVAVIAFWVHAVLTDVYEDKMVACLHFKNLEEVLVPEKRVIDDDAQQCRDELKISEEHPVDD